MQYAAVSCGVVVTCVWICTVGRSGIIFFAWAGVQGLAERHGRDIFKTGDPRRYPEREASSSGSEGRWSRWRSFCGHNSGLAVPPCAIILRSAPSYAQILLHSAHVQFQHVSHSTQHQKNFNPLIYSSITSEIKERSRPNVACLYARLYSRL